MEMWAEQRKGFDLLWPLLFIASLFFEYFHEMSDVSALFYVGNVAYNVMLLCWHNLIIHKQIIHP